MLASMGSTDSVESTPCLSKMRFNISDALLHEGRRSYGDSSSQIQPFLPEDVPESGQTAKLQLLDCSFRPAYGGSRLGE